jgi:hypothetical protein
LIGDPTRRRCHSACIAHRGVRGIATATIRLKADGDDSGLRPRQLADLLYTEGAQLIATDIDP